MFKARVFWICVIVGLLTPPLSCLSATVCIDELTFGDSASEAAHSVIAVNSATGTGGLGQSYRKLLKYSPARDYGGHVAFTVNVDPEKQNYLTVKLWGSDHATTTDRYICLYFYDVNGKQLGYRHECDLLPLDRCSADNFFPNRFVYSTHILPLSMTQGKTSITLKIDVWGYFWPYGTNWDACQNQLLEDSRGLYKLYTHTDPFFEPDASEIQGSPPAIGPVQPGDGQDNLTELRNAANFYVTTLLGKAASSMNAFEVMHLARVYESSWAAKYHSSDVLDKVRDALDYYANYQGTGGDKNIFGWQGHGYLGEALMEVYNGLNSRGDLSQTVNFGSGNVTRRTGYADFFADGRDWRMLDRRFFTNQVMYCIISACAADRAAKMLDPSYAWTDAYALSIARQGVGLSPLIYTRVINYNWYGWNVQLPNPYGDYYTLTSKGLSKELAYVCYYGEIGNLYARLADIMDEPEITQQAIKFVGARAPFQFFDNDKNGYRAMRVEAAIGTRHNEQIGRVSYQDDTLEIAAVLRDPISVRFAQLYIEHNRIDSNITYLRDIDKVKCANDYAAVLNLPASEYRFPMGDGQPDFIWTDEDDAVVAAKVGPVRFYTEMYWITPTISNIARVHYTTPSMDRIASIMGESEYTPSGISMTRENNPAHPESSFTPPPAELNLHSFHAGETLPVAAGQMGGRAEFYKLKYGPFRIGMNCTNNKSFQYAPEGFVSGVDLVSGQTLTAPVTVGPKTTVIFFVTDPLECGDNGTTYLEADLNVDCYVNMVDFAILASEWLADGTE